MKSTWIKCAALTVLAGAAAWSAVSALSASARWPPARRKSARRSTTSPACAIEEAEFVLREYNGCIGVFSPQSDAGPITVTDIETRSLREADREIVKNGIAVADREELLTLLEDFGS